MSAATPMLAEQRITRYRRAGRVTLTPRQWQRTRHKWARHTGTAYGHWGDKQRYTPRRVNAIPARWWRRKHAEEAR